MDFLRWLFSGIVLSASIVVAGVVGNGFAFMSQAEAGSGDAQFHMGIVNIERAYKLTEFDVSKKQHLLRKTRVEYYIAEAKQADIRGWTYKREQLVERAQGLLSYHQSRFVFSEQV
jgi:hypothetical protein